jgi:hypothetical protein
MPEVVVESRQKQKTNLHTLRLFKRWYFIVPDRNLWAVLAKGPLEIFQGLGLRSERPFRLYFVPVFDTGG